MTNIIVIRAFVNRTVFGRVPRTKRGRPRRRCDRAVINSRDASQGVLVLVSSWTRRTVAPTQRWGLVSSSCAPSPSAASRPQNACLARTGALDSGRSGATKTQRHPPPPGRWPVDVGEKNYQSVVVARLGSVETSHDVYEFVLH